MDLYHKLKWGNRIFYTLMIFNSIFLGIYNYNDIDYLYRYVIYGLLCYRSLSMIQADVKFIYYIIWTRTYIYPLIIMYDIYCNGSKYYMIDLFMFSEIYLSK